MTREQKCDRCGKRYFRVQKTHLWTTINLGHRKGWALAETRVCVHCLNQDEARTLFREILPKWRNP